MIIGSFDYLDRWPEVLGEKSVCSSKGEQRLPAPKEKRVNLKLSKKVKLDEAKTK